MPIIVPFFYLILLGGCIFEDFHFLTTFIILAKNVMIAILGLGTDDDHLNFCSIYIVN